jgi:hypothetical protein
MTGEESTPKTPENSYYIPSKENTMTKDPKPAEKKSGNDLLGLAYVVIGIFVLIAAFQLYFTIQDLIRTWFSDQFVPVISSVYYVAVIVAGVWLIREYIRKQ